MSVPPRTVIALLLTLGAVAPAAADVVYETTVRITDSLAAGTAEIEQTIRTSVTPSARREDVTGPRRVAVRRGRQYDRPGHRVRIELLDGAAAYDLDLEAGFYTRTPFAETARDRERALTEAEATVRAAPPDAPLSRPVIITRGSERASVNGMPCWPVRLEVSRDAAGADRGADAAPSGRFVMSLDLCMTEESEVAALARSTEARVRELTGDTDPHLARLLEVLARRRDLFAVFDDLHYRLERERRNLTGIALRWVEQMTGPQRGNANTVLFRLEATVKTLESGAVDPAEFTIPASLRSPSGAARR
jgi:hypothetical protein